MLSTDGSGRRLESHTGDKIRKTLISDENFDVFFNFRQNQIQNCFVQVKKMKGGIFSLQMKKKNASVER